MFGSKIYLFQKNTQDLVVWSKIKVQTIFYNFRRKKALESASASASMMQDAINFTIASASASMMQMQIQMQRFFASKCMPDGVLKKCPIIKYLLVQLINILFHSFMLFSTNN